MKSAKRDIREKSVTETCNRSVTSDRDRGVTPTVARAHTPSPRDTEFLSRFEEGRDTGERDKRDVTAESVTVTCPALGGPHHHHEDQGAGRTDFAEQILLIAHRVLDEQRSGRSVDPMRMQWAEHIVASNAEPSLTHRARAQGAAL